MMKLQEEEFQRIVQQTIIKKKSAEAIFEALIEHVKNIIETRANDENAAKSKTVRDIELVLADCKSAHTKSLEIFNEVTAENEIKWIGRIQTRYNETMEKSKTFTAMTENRNNARRNCALWMEKATLL